MVVVYRCQGDRWSRLSAGLRNTGQAFQVYRLKAVKILTSFRALQPLHSFRLCCCPEL